MVERVAHFNGFGQVQIIPSYSTIIHTVKARIQSAGDVYDRAIGIFRYKVADQLVKNDSSRDNSSAHRHVILRIAKIIVKFGNYFLSFCVMKFMFRIFTVHRPSIKALEHGFRRAIERRLDFFTHDNISVFSLQGIMKRLLLFVTSSRPANPRFTASPVYSFG